MAEKWFTKLQQHKSISREELDRRRKMKKTKQEGKKRKQKTPAQKINAIAESHGLSTSGNTETVALRILQFLADTIQEQQIKGAPECFGVGFTEAKCEDCWLQEICIPIFKTFKQLKIANKKRIIKERIRRLKTNG